MITIERVDQLLSHWASWHRKLVDGGFGYPRKTIEAEAAIYGGAPPRARGQMSIPMDQESEKMEQAVAQLRLYNGQLYAVIRDAYCREYPQRVIAERLRVSQPTVGRLMKEAKGWICGYLHQYAA